MSVKNKVKGLLHIVLFFSLLVSCGGQRTERSNAARNDIRFGKRFFSIYISDSSSAYVVKRIGTYYTEPLQVESSDTSAIFTLDFSDVYFKYFDSVKNNPILDFNRSDAPRIEIYYGKEEVYDVYKWSESFWNMFRRVMGQLPKGFSPFRVNKTPF